MQLLLDRVDNPNPIPLNPHQRLQQRPEYPGDRPLHWIFPALKERNLRMDFSSGTVFSLNPMALAQWSSWPLFISVEKRLNLMRWLHNSWEI
ncbi:hypothetical protein IFM89_030206 [Coptis chinensis]|uniref:Uncharacterized protein n=1 Tax=Coptis chinensis TaxID=261450 RepID=A0A835HKQ5_9MAGN|nr:hypothetical protein IFM89_030206 [Coptis chinensis]